MQSSTSGSTTNLSIQRGVRTFYALAVAQTISQIGSSMSFLAVGIYVYQKTGEATPLALLSFFMILPYLIVSGLAGVLADRYDRRTLMIIGDTGAALGSLALVISVSSGNFQVWHVYAAGLWQAIFGTFQRSAFEASVSQLVPDSQRQSANAIMQIGKPASLLLSSALTGVLYATIGVIGMFQIDLISFLIAVSTTLLARIPAPERTEVGAQARGSMLSEWRSGASFLWTRRPLFIMTVLIALFSFFISSVFALMTPYVLARTGSELALGMLTAIMSVGGLVGAIAIGAWGGFKKRITTIMLALILVLVATMVFGADQPPVVLGTALFIAMMGVSGANATFMTLLQSKVPGDMQGRIFALFTQATLLLTPLGYLLIGPLADGVFTPLASSAAWAEGVPGMLFGSSAAGGMGGLFTISAVLALIATLIAYALPSIRNLEDLLPTYASAADAPQVASAPTPEPAVSSN